jgi:hypothetical protein
VCQLDGKERKIQAQACSDEGWLEEDFFGEKTLISLLTKKIDSMVLPSVTFVHVYAPSLFWLRIVTDKWVAVLSWCIVLPLFMSVSFLCLLL